MSIISIIKKKIRGIGRRTGLMDDFDWSSYNEKEYASQVHELEKQYTFVLSDGKYFIENGKIKLDSGLLSLNEHHEALYESIIKLNPESVLEVGFGGGDHLYNIKKLIPQVAINGVDLLPTQLEFLRKRHPELEGKANLLIRDITLLPVKEVNVDLVYTQAVIMHIQRHNSYLSALKNIFYSAKKYVVLQENWTRHNFLDDIKKISSSSNFPWKELYFYMNDTGKQVALILSNTKLSDFKEVKSNEELLKYYKR
ncbi:MAG: class I SAM-dependent methyltransferase [Candidatus Staskawiczbacteria bacterium]|nr:class I SAM-dependent methyltransferase [Candidatus Staskawiczbacteria bacterium]